MKRLVILSLVVMVSLSAFAADLKVVANSSVTASAISTSELKDVFLQNSNALGDGSKVTPVLSNGGSHKALLLILGKTDAALQTYYRSLVFTGKASMPKTAASDAEVVAYVAKTKGAVGYVSPDAATAGVKVLTVK